MSKFITFRDVLRGMHNIYEAKNFDYGNSFELSALLLGRPVVEGLLHRLCDKLARCCNLVRSGQSMVTDESLCDTLLDLSIYSILAILALNTPAETACKCGGKCNGGQDDHPQD